MTWDEVRSPPTVLLLLIPLPFKEANQKDEIPAILYSHRSNKTNIKQARCVPKLRLLAIWNWFMNIKSQMTSMNAMIALMISLWQIVDSTWVKLSEVLTFFFTLIRVGLCLLPVRNSMFRKQYVLSLYKDTRHPGILKSIHQEWLRQLASGQFLFVYIDF